MIVEDDDQAKRLASLIVEDGHVHTFLDYMSSPQPSGYRGIHIVYRLDAPSYGYSGLDVEIQVRSMLQHDRAAAVEAYDLISGTNLKFGEGSNAQKEYFRIVSDLMCGSVSDEPTAIRRLIELEQRLSIYKQLHEAMDSMFVVEDGIIDIDRTNICLITVQPEVQEVDLKVFGIGMEEEAAREYTRLEGTSADGKLYLSARASSLDNLKKAYPDYYLNISECMRWLEKKLF